MGSHETIFSSHPILIYKGPVSAWENMQMDNDQPICFSLFFITVTKYPKQTNFMTKKAYLAHSFEILRTCTDIS
jgi:hypothetical protein